MALPENSDQVRSKNSGGARSAIFSVDNSNENGVTLLDRSAIGGNRGHTLKRSARNFCADLFFVHIKVIDSFVASNMIRAPSTNGSGLFTATRHGMPYSRLMIEAWHVIPLGLR